ELWFGTNEGLFRLSSTATGSPEKVPADMAMGQVHDLKPEGNSLWIGAQKGLFHLKPGAKQPIATARGMGAVFRVALCRRTLWGGAENGIFRRDIAGEFRREFFGLEIKLRGTDIVETESALWITTTRQLSIFHRSLALPNPASGKLYRWTKQAGTGLQPIQ